MNTETERNRAERLELLYKRYYMNAARALVAMDAADAADFDEMVAALDNLIARENPTEAEEKTYKAKAREHVLGQLA